MALEGLCVSSKSPLKVNYGNVGIAGGNEKEPHPSQCGAIDLPSKQINGFEP